MLADALQREMGDPLLSEMKLDGTSMYFIIEKERNQSLFWITRDMGCLTTGFT